MSAAVHTPGPWTRDKYGSVLAPNGREVMFRGLSIACSGSMVAEAEKNTDLIVAAPDLLAALKGARRELHACQAVIHLAGGFDPAYVKDAQSALKDVDAAIAKATGVAQ